MGPQERLLDVVRHDLARPLVHIYFGCSADDPASADYSHEKGEPGFAGSTFLCLEPNRPFAILSSDLLAVSLLDVAFGPRAVQLLLHDEKFQKEVSDLLCEIPVDASLANTKTTDLQPAEKLWDLLCELPGAGPVKAGKLLARKRPQLIPVVDRVVMDVVQAPPRQYWTTFQEFMQSEAGLEETTRLRPGRLPELPLLRVLDAAIWMGGSNGRQVQRAREHLGAPRSPLL